MQIKRALEIQRRALDIQRDSGCSRSEAASDAKAEYSRARNRRIAALRTFGELVEPSLAGTWRRTEIGEWLFQMRAWAELSRESMDRRAGLGQGSVAAFESGTRVPTFDEINGLAAALSSGMPLGASDESPC